MSVARILVVEDDLAVRGMIRYVLEEAGHEVEEVSNGEDAVRRYQEAPADLVITDTFMPPSDGLRVIKDIRDLNRGARIIAICSSFGFGPASLEEARRLGAVRTLPKPIDAQRLRDAVSESLPGEPN